MSRIISDQLIDSIRSLAPFTESLQESVNPSALLASNRRGRASPQQAQSQKHISGSVASVRLGFQNLSQTDRASFGFSSFR